MNLIKIFWKQNVMNARQRTDYHYLPRPPEIIDIDIRKTLRIKIIKLHMKENIFNILITHERTGVEYLMAHPVCHAHEFMNFINVFDSVSRPNLLFDIFVADTRM